MVRVEKYIPISFTIVATVACYMVTFVSLPWMWGYNKAKYFFLAVVFSYIAYNIRFLKCAWVSLATKATLIIYIAFSFIASIWNIGDVTGTNMVAQCILHCGIISANFCLAVIVSNNHGKNSFLSIYTGISSFIYIITDLSVLVGYKSGSFFIGTKFSVAFFHFIALSLFLIKTKEWNKRNRILIIILFAETLVINIISGCATGIVGTVLFALFVYLNFRSVRAVRNPFLQVSTLLISAAFPFWYELLLSSRFAKIVVEDILHKQMTLTGRTVIYSMLPQIIGRNYYWGYGINSNMEICMRWGAVNIQNGLLKIFMESGIFGAISVIVLVFLVFYQVRKTDSSIVKVISSYWLVISILSAIEITINASTLVVLLYLSVFSKQEKEVVL